MTMITEEKRLELRAKRIQKKENKNNPTSIKKPSFDIPSFVDVVTASFFKLI